MNLDSIECKDYFIIKVKCYADRRILDQFGLSHPQHWERAQLSLDFFWALVEKVTGENQNYFFEKYMFNTMDCAKEEIQDTHNILQYDIESHYLYFIPKEHKKIIDWIIENIKSPHKILKKTHTGYRIQDTDYRRKESLLQTEKFKDKIFIAENTRNVLIEKKSNLFSF